MVFINLNRLEAIMPIEETIPGERYRLGQLIKAVVVEVRQDKGDPRVILSRKSDKFLRCLLEFEVPEIEEGSVVIKGIARVPGLKSKIAVGSLGEHVSTSAISTDPPNSALAVFGQLSTMSIMSSLSESSKSLFRYTSLEGDCMKFLNMHG